MKDFFKGWLSDVFVAAFPWTFGICCASAGKMALSLPQDWSDWGRMIATGASLILLTLMSLLRIGIIK